MVTPHIIRFLESKARMTGQIRESYFPRGLIKTGGYAGQYYQVCLHQNEPILT